MPVYMWIYNTHTHTWEFIHLCTCMQVYLKNTFCSSEEEFLWEHLKNTFLQKNFHHHDTVTFPNWNIFLMLKEILNAWWWKWTQCLEVILIKLSYANFNNYPTCYIKKDSAQCGISFNKRWIQSNQCEFALVTSSLEVAALSMLQSTKVLRPRFSKVYRNNSEIKSA